MSYLKGVVGQVKIYIRPLQQSLDISLIEGEYTVRDVWARQAYIVIIIYRFFVLKKHVIVAVQFLLASSETTQLLIQV